jgi:ribose transport system substrate-binding protein
MAADAMAEAIGRKGDIAYIGRPFASTSEERLESFLRRIRKYPDIRIIANLSLKTATRAEAKKATEELLGKVKDIAGIFCVNDDCALGALGPIAKSGRKIRIVSFDGDPRILRKVDSGVVYADVKQDPWGLGAKAIEVIGDFLGGKKTPAKVVVPVECYRSR